MTTFLAVFFVLAALAVMLFVGWVVVNGIRSVWRLAVGGPAAADASTGPRCRNAGCRVINPPHARFCRRCGSPMMAGPGPTAAMPAGPSVSVSMASDRHGPAVSATVVR